jgi:hypothetical protein
LAKERSPNYPAFGLEGAVQSTKALWDKERRTPVSVEVAAKAMGYSSPSGKLSGSALTRIASVRQYGLIEKAGTGKVRVAEAALNFWLHKPTEPEFQKAAREAALRPPLFQMIHSQYPEGSNDAINAYLVKSGFSPEGSARVIKAYRETEAFANLRGNSYNGEDGGEENGDFQHENPEEKPKLRHKRPPPGGSVEYSWPLGGGTKVELVFTNEPTQKQLDVMLAQLNIMREVAPAESAPSIPEDGNE